MSPKLRWGIALGAMLAGVLAAASSLRFPVNNRMPAAPSAYADYIRQADAMAEHILSLGDASNTVVHV